MTSESKCMAGYKHSSSLGNSLSNPLQLYTLLSEHAGVGEGGHVTEFLFIDWLMLSWTAVDYGGRPRTLTSQDIQWQHRGLGVEDEET